MALLQCETGGDLLSQAHSNQVPSAQLDLTSVFGMGTGVTPALSLPRLLHSVGRVRSLQLLISIQLSKPEAFRKPLTVLSSRIP